MAKPVHKSTKFHVTSGASLPLCGAAQFPPEAMRPEEQPSPVLLPAHTRYVSDKDLASVIASSRSTIWRYVQLGVLPAPIKIGGLTRFDLDHALACIRAGKIVPAPGGRA